MSLRNPTSQSSLHLHNQHLEPREHLPRYILHQRIKLLDGFDDFSQRWVVSTSHGRVGKVQRVGREGREGSLPTRMKETRTISAIPNPPSRPSFLLPLLGLSILKMDDRNPNGPKKAAEKDSCRKEINPTRENPLIVCANALLHIGDVGSTWRLFPARRGGTFPVIPVQNPVWSDLTRGSSPARASILSSKNPTAVRTVSPRMT